MRSGPRLLLDEHMPGEIAAALRSRGHDVLAVIEEPALVGLDDRELFEWASSEGRVIVTENAPDFISLFADRVAAGLDSAGILCTDNRRFPRHRSELFIGWMVRALDERLRTQVPLTGRVEYLG